MSTPEPQTPRSAPDPADLRVEYGRQPLREEDLHADPFEQFGLWFGQACEAGLLEPNAMVLSTVDREGRPTSRTVLMKHWDPRGIVFFTNLESRKARHIGENPRVSLLFTWLPLHRQLAVNGIAERTSRTEVMNYFLRRPVGSQIAAWASPQSRVIEARAVLEKMWSEMKQKFREGSIPVPPFWGGFRVVPDQFEFWQGGENRLHDRFVYHRQPDGSWRHERWAP